MWATLNFYFFKDPTFFYLSARLIFGVFAGTYSIWLLYRMIRERYSEKVALLSAFFLAVNFLHVRDSHYVYADIPLLAVLIAAFSCVIDIAQGRKRGWQVHLHSGALIGLAVAVKYNGVVLVLPYLLASLWSEDRKKILLYGSLAAAAALLLYTLANPFTWLDFNFFWKEISMQSQAAGKTGAFHHLAYSLQGAVGPGLFIAGLLGIGAGIREGQKHRGILIFFIVVYFLLLVFKSQPYDRYVLPLIPFFLFFAADGLSLAAVRIFPERWEKKGLALLGILFALPPLGKSLLSDHLFLQKDVRDVAKEWVETTIAPGSKLALEWEFFMPRLRFTRKQLEEKLEMIPKAPYFSKAQERRIQFLLADPVPQRYSLYFLSEPSEGERFLFGTPAVPFKLSELKRRGIEYVFVARVQEEHVHSEFYKELREKAEPVKRFSPYRNPEREYPFDRQPLTGGPFLWKELISRERNGQPIEVYRLR